MACAQLQQLGQLALTSEQQHALLASPSSQQPHALVALLEAQGLDRRSAGRLAVDAGCELVLSPIASVVAAAQQSGALCILAHPGRADGFICFDEELLDALRREVPIDGLEVYYPLHTLAQVAQFHAYALTHELLISAGSDSHGPERPPIRYAAGQCRALLERLGIQVGA